MKKLLIVGAVGLTAATFYGAMWHKSEAIEEDIRARVTEEIAATTQPDISVGVDGRHVTLTGVVHDVDRERHLLNVARNTYGALGPIDGLTYAAQNGFVSAIKTADGIRLAGTVPDDATLTRLLDAAKLATDGTIEHGLEVAGAAGPWHDEAGFGLEQLGQMSVGTMTAGAGSYVLSGTAKDDATAIRTALDGRDGWHGQVSGPDLSGDLNAQVAGLEADLKDSKTTVSDQSDTIVELRSQVSALEGERETQRLSFLGDLKTKDDALTDQQATITSLQTELDRLRADAGVSNDLTAKLAAATAEGSELATGLAERDAVITSLTADLKLAQDSLSAEAATNVELSDQLAAAQTRITERNAELSTLSASATQRETLLAERDTAIASLTADLKLAQDSLSAEAATNVELSDQLAAAQTRITERNAELSALSANAAQREALLAERDATISELQVTLDKLRDASTEQQENTKALAADLAETQAALDAERSSFAADIKAKEAVVSEQDTTIETLKSDLKAATTTAAEVDPLRKALATKTADHEAALARISEIEDHVKQESAAASANRAMIDDLNNQLSKREKQVAALATEMSERDATIASLQSAPTNALQIDQCTERTDSVIEGTRINFVTASAEISADSTPLLERLTGIAIACSGSGAVLEVGGHTDDRGEEENNQTLSEARAAAVVSFMAARGVPTDGLNAIGYGETKPIADNETDEGRAANRRISFAWQAR